MNNKSSRDPTISFRPKPWAREIIEQRVALSGMSKKDFLTRSCVYSNIVVTGTEENIQRIVDALQDMQATMIEIVREINSGNIPLSEDNMTDMRNNFLALAVTVVDILDGAAYLFNKLPPDNRKDWKTEIENNKNI